MERRATNFAIRLMACKSLPELKAISEEIRTYMASDLKFKSEWRSWLLDIHWSKNKELSGPDIPFEETLNVTGRKWYAKEKLAKAKDV